ncbi:MAG: hypothetical protein VKK04_06935 [Synechococcales bacterium]|nr:hypothetical protein [Synechococcales bacterium]
MNSKDLEAAGWYIVRQAAGHCDIISAQELEASNVGDRPESDRPEAANDIDADEGQRWGPFASQGEAIARRVGLIRSGKCRPV